MAIRDSDSEWAVASFDIDRKVGALRRDLWIRELMSLEVVLAGVQEAGQELRSSMGHAGAKG